MRRISTRLSALRSSPSFWICAAGLAAMAYLFAQWMIINPLYTLPALLSALVSAALFVVLCLRFVPEWMRFWRLSPEQPAFRSEKDGAHSAAPAPMCLKIFLTLFLLNALVLLAVFLIRKSMGYHETFLQSLEFWRCTDSGSYLNIAQNWYPTEGEAVVQLVFLPGYPVAIRLINWLIGNELISGLIVSALCFPGAGCMLYKLMRLDYSHEDSLRAVKYLCILPGVFFFTTPMSEGLFLLLCLSCLYCARAGRWTLGCLLGGLAAFTRSLGVTLLVPLIMELVRAIRVRIVAGKSIRSGRWILRALALLLVASGFGAYLLINYQISGDFFKFQEYQLSHWGQQLGLFFNTAAYQMSNAVNNYHDNFTTFLGLWLPNLISCFSALILMIAAAKRMRASYVAWFIAYFFIAIGATWLLSAPRYLMVMLTLPLSFTVLTRRPDADLAFTPVCITASLLYLYAFVARWQVW